MPLWSEQKTTSPMWGTDEWSKALTGGGGTAPAYTPTTGYGTQAGNYYYAQTGPSGGAWSTIPMTPAPTGSVLGTTTTPTGGTVPTGGIAPTGGETKLTTGSYAPESLTQSQRQSLWEAAGHAGIAPVGYGGEPTEGVGVPGVDKEAAMASISAAWAPLYESIQRKIGLLPEEQAGLEKRIEDLYTFLGQERGVSEAKVGRELETAKTGEVTRAARTLRDLSETARGVLGAAGNIFGGSSAVPAVTAGLTKTVTRKRADILAQRDEMLSLLDQRGIDIQEAAGLERQRIETWKANQLADIGTKIGEKLESLRTQFDVATAEEKKYLSNLAMTEYQDAVARLRAIDEQKMNFDYMVDLAEEQARIGLQSYKDQLVAMATYSPGTYGYDTSQMSIGQIQALVNATKQPQYWGGYLIQPETTEENWLWKTDESGRDILFNPVTQETKLPSLPGQTQPSGPSTSGLGF